MTANPPPSSTRSIPSPADRGQGVRAASGIPADFRSRPAFSSAILAMSRGGGGGATVRPLSHGEYHHDLHWHPLQHRGDRRAVLAVVHTGSLRVAILRWRQRRDMGLSDRCRLARLDHRRPHRKSHTSELQSLMRHSYAVFSLNNKKMNNNHTYSKRIPSTT